MTNVQSGLHSLLFRTLFQIWKYIVIYFPGTHSTMTATVLTSICLHVILSLKGMSSTEISPTRASLEAESAAEFLLMPT